LEEALWRDNFREEVIKNQEYNFGGQLLFEYDHKEKALTVKENSH
jgi:hypothetical protein